MFAQPALGEDPKVTSLGRSVSWGLLATLLLGSAGCVVESTLSPSDGAPSAGGSATVATGGSTAGGGGSGGASSGGASSSGGSANSLFIPSSASGGTTSLGADGGVSVTIAAREVVLEPLDPSLLTFTDTANEANDFTMAAQLKSGWTFEGLELLADQRFIWALTRNAAAATLVVFDTHSCDGPLGQIQLPPEFVQNRRLVFGEEAFLSCDDASCLLVAGLELEVLGTLTASNFTWLKRGGATLCMGNDDRLVCRRGDGVVSEPLAWKTESLARGRLADVHNCAVFEDSQLCMTDSGAWEELPIAVGPPPPPTCDTLWLTGGYDPNLEQLTETCAEASGKAPPIAETRSMCGSAMNKAQVTTDAYSATCECFKVG